jgi:hypothetical protein
VLTSPACLSVAESRSAEGKRQQAQNLSSAGEHDNR